MLVGVCGVEIVSGVRRSLRLMSRKLNVALLVDWTI